MSQVTGEGNLVRGECRRRGTRLRIMTFRTFCRVTATLSRSWKSPPCGDSPRFAAHRRTIIGQTMQDRVMNRAVPMRTLALSHHLPRSWGADDNLGRTTTINSPVRKQTVPIRNSTVVSVRQKLSNYEVCSVTARSRVVIPRAKLGNVAVRISLSDFWHTTGW